MRSDAVGAGAVLILVTGLGWLSWPADTSDDIRMARGTVVHTAQCDSSGAHDGLRLELLDGRAIPARLDGCGHRPGEVLTVEVADPLPSGDVIARLPGTGVPASTASAQRIGAVGVAVAGIAGALLAWRLRGCHS